VESEKLNYQKNFILKKMVNIKKSFGMNMKKILNTHLYVNQKFGMMKIILITILIIIMIKL